MAGPNQIGFNHNVKHQGQAYHVQTEDSGPANPRIVTHLFVGGNILASKKITYGEIAGADDIGRLVRELMEDQHKEMLRNLISGVYDHVDAAYQARAYQPGQLADEQPETAEAQLSVEGVLGEAPQAAAPGEGVPFPPLFDPAPAQPGVAFPPLFDPTAPAPAAAPVHYPRLFDQAAPLVSGGVNYPRLFDPTAVETPAAAAPLLPEEAVEAIFGEDILSEKSLDEVILSYLVEDDDEAEGAEEKP